MKYSKTFIEQRLAGVPEERVLESVKIKIAQLESINDGSEHIQSALMELKALRAQFSQDLKEVEEVPSFSM